MKPYHLHDGDETYRVQFCPFCGSKEVGRHSVTKLGFCATCRKTFSFSYVRQLKKAQKK